MSVGISEKEFIKQVIQFAKLMRWRTAHFRPAMNRRGVWETPVQGDGKGFLDLMLVRDRPVAVELKVGKNKTTPEQDDWIEAWKKAGVECYVWRPDDWDEIQKVLT